MMIRKFRCPKYELHIIEDEISERCSRVVNTPASNWGGSRVQISARRPAALTEDFRNSTL
jgi:hypothetical protein